MLIVGSQSSQIQRDRKQNSGCQGLGGGENGELWNGYRTSVLQDEKSAGDWLHYSVNVLISLLNCTLKNGQDGKFYVKCILPQVLKIANHINSRPAMNTHLQQGKIYKPNHDHFSPGLEMCTDLKLQHYMSMFHALTMSSDIAK